MASEEEADLAFVFGIGFAMHLGGPLFYARQRGWRIEITSREAVTQFASLRREPPGPEIASAPSDSDTESRSPRVSFARPAAGLVMLPVRNRVSNLLAPPSDPATDEGGSVMKFLTWENAALLGVAAIIAVSAGIPGPGTSGSDPAELTRFTWTWSSTTDDTVEAVVSIDSDLPVLQCRHLWARRSSFVEPGRRVAGNLRCPRPRRFPRSTATTWRPPWCSDLPETRRPTLGERLADDRSASRRFRPSKKKKGKKDKAEAGTAARTRTRTGAPTPSCPEPVECSEVGGLLRDPPILSRAHHLTPSRSSARRRWSARSPSPRPPLRRGREGSDPVRAERRRLPRRLRNLDL